MKHFKFHIILEAIKKKLEEILPDNSRAVLYGSRARGDSREDSDWDIHILVPGEEKLDKNQETEFAFPLEMLGWNLNESFSVMVFSHKGWEKRRFLPFYKNVETDKLILYNTLKNDSISYRQATNN